MHNFVQTTTENGRKILSFGYGSVVSKAFAKPANWAEIIVKAIHCQMEEIVRSSFMSRMEEGEVEFTYYYFENTDTCYAKLLLPGMLLGQATYIYDKIKCRFDTATEDAFAEGSSSERLKILFRIGNKIADFEHAQKKNFNFIVTYSSILERREMTGHDF